MAFESFLDDTAPLLRQQVLRVGNLPAHEELEFDMGARIKVDKSPVRESGQPDTVLWVELSPETAGGFASMIGVAEEMEAVYPQGIRFVVQAYADNGYFVLADPKVEGANQTWIQMTPWVLEANARREAGEGYLRMYEMRTPGIDEESPMFQALLDPSIALAGTEYAVDVATQRIKG